MNVSKPLFEEAVNAIGRFRHQKATAALAESCTGGLCAAALTEVPGASAVLLCGYTVYSNEAKERCLGVSPQTLSRYGAVSAQTVTELLNGLRLQTGCTVAGAVSGIAGPDGGTDEKPVGTVFIGAASDSGLKVERCFFSGDRTAVRSQSAVRLLQMIVEQLS